MRCFYHGDVEAVAVCKACGHGICHDCCAEVGNGGACRNRCEGDVAALNKIIERNRTVYSKASALHRRNGWLFIVAGLAFGLVIFYLGSDEPPNPLLLVLTAFFLVAGVFSLINARRFADK
jgi:hypothetical protein